MDRELKNLMLNINQLAAIAGNMSPDCGGKAEKYPASRRT
ncbi:Uncharacterised protein [Escherichia coli]|nr:Uncharacterised protein [Escherichia coli]